MALKIGKLYTGSKPSSCKVFMYVSMEALREAYSSPWSRRYGCLGCLFPADAFLVLEHQNIKHPGNPKVQVNVYKILLGSLQQPMWVLLPNEGAWVSRVS